MAQLRAEKYEAQRELQKKWPSSQIEFRRANRKEGKGIYRPSDAAKEKTKARVKKWSQEQRVKNPLFKIKDNCRNRIRKVLNGWSKSASSQQLIGCSWLELRTYLESQFSEGMTWENYGKFGWHIDHIIPLSSAKTLEEIEKLCHYTNLQPLWWRDNIVKSNKILPS